MSTSNPITQIEQLAKAYRAARDTLAERAQLLYQEMEAAKQRRLKGLRSAVASVTETEAELRAAIEAHKGLFEKPRSRVLAGVQLGYRKAKGSIDWADDDQVVKLIRRHLSEQAEVLIRTTEAPVKTALAGLPAADLKRIGVTVKDAGDEVLIKDTTAPVDKLVDALLKGATAEAEAEEA